MQMCVSGSAGTMTPPKIYQRVLAVNAYRTQGGVMKAARGHFLASCKKLNLDPPQRVATFITRWEQYYAQHGHVEGDAHNSGRTPKISKPAATQLVEELADWAKLGQSGPFASLKQLQKSSPIARTILQEADAAVSTVIRAIKKAEPLLAYELLAAKQKLTARQKAARVRVASKHIKLSDKELELVVWVDAKTMYMSVRPRCGWVLRSDAVPLETSRPTSKKNPITLKYYIGVCGRTGAVFLQFYTGTTGMKADRNPRRPYLVRSCDVQLAQLLLYSSSNCLLDHCPPACAAPKAVPRYQPHHMKTLPHSTCCQSMVSGYAAVQIGADAVGPVVWLLIMLLSLHSKQHPGRL